MLLAAGPGVLQEPGAGSAQRSRVPVVLRVMEHRVVAVVLRVMERRVVVVPQSSALVGWLLVAEPAGTLQRVAVGAAQRSRVPAALVLVLRVPAALVLVLLVLVGRAVVLTMERRVAGVAPQSSVPVPVPVPVLVPAEREPEPWASGVQARVA